MSLQTWQETLMIAQVDGTALSNTTTPTSIIPAAAKFTLPANYFSIGKALKITAKGRASNVVTTPGNWTMSVLFGATTVWTGGAVAISTAAHTNVTFLFDVLLTCRAIGTTGNLIGIGQFQCEWWQATANNAQSVNLPVSAPAVGNNFDTTTAQVVDLQGTFSVASASNSITLHEYTLESLN